MSWKMALQVCLRRGSAKLAESHHACYAQARNASSLQLPELPYDYRFSIVHHLSLYGSLGFGVPLRQVLLIQISS